MAKTILIADDDPVQRRMAKDAIDGLGYDSIQAENAAEMGAITADSLVNIALVIIDLDLVRPDGYRLLGELKNKLPNTPIIIQTAAGGIETVVTAMRAGASDFLIKPVSPKRLGQSVKKCLNQAQSPKSNDRQKIPANNTISFADIIASSPKMQQVINLAKKAASSNIPVIIEGETGVGKEMIAHAIQNASKRANQNFVTVNCGALPENLIESVLFGHEKGSFTGATQRHIGKFQEADGGTLFLDEVGELPLATQVKLLRALQQGEVDPIGSKRPVRTNFRLISATNLDLAIAVEEGKFRDDLFYRLNAFPIDVPPLRHRRREIPALADHFLRKFTNSEDRGQIKSIDEDAKKLLIDHHWPGNIRQLENAVFQAVVLCEGDRLKTAHFPQIKAGRNIDAPELSPEQTPTLKLDETPPLSPATLVISKKQATNLVSEEGQVRCLEEIESDVIRFALELYDGNLSEVSKRLKIGRSTLYRRIKEMEQASTIKNSV